MSITFLRRLCLPFLLASVLAACGTVPLRNPMPLLDGELAPIPGLPDNARFWGDEVSPGLIERIHQAETDAVKETMPSWHGQKLNFLAISGGGQDGAFGAGLLAGWTAAGDRPEFQIVTGVSTGALSAPFVFLGPEYDDVLRDIYLTHGTADLLAFRPWTMIVTGDAAIDTNKLHALITDHLDETMIRRLAEETRRGRRLYIGTTNLDSARPVIWNITAIADSDYPDKVDLIADVLLASASIPGAFPPMLIKIEKDGVVYDELHVDGGAVSQVFIYPTALDFAFVLNKLESPPPFNVYVIRNSKIKPSWKPVTPGIFSITKSSIASMIRTQGLGDLSTIYLLAQRDGGNFNLAYIPDSIVMEPEEPFDQKYMKVLFDIGYGLAARGMTWDTIPPTARVHEFE